MQKPTRVLFIAPHLSTGGCPQYLLKKLEVYKEDIEAYVVEVSFLGYAYVVQRNAILNLLPDGNFFSLGEDKSEILSIIDSIDPDIVHFEELSENMLNYEILSKIYLKESRRYYITETTHSSESNPDTKVFLPDRFIFASKYSLENYKKLGVESEVWEYPIDIREKPDRNTSLMELGLDPSKVHVLNVGLFTPGKNQGEIFSLAKKFENVIFHFVGNQAPNFENYWAPLMENRPHNCIVWGERNDVEKFFRACDIFYFSSIFELNPLVIKEALSWKLPVLIHDLHTYMGTYDGNENAHYLSNIEDDNCKLLNELVEKVEISTQRYRTKIVHLVSEIFNEMEQESIRSISSLASKEIEYTVHYNPLTRAFDPDKLPMFENPNLKPGHFGCYEAFRKAICEDFTDDYDFVIVCERDCILEREVGEIHALLHKTYSYMERSGIDYFSFGDKVDLDNGYLQSKRIEDVEDFAFLTDKIIGLQFIIFSKRGREFLRYEFENRDWYGMDIWFNVVYNENEKLMGILNDRVTTQLDGYSLIDQTNKTFKANQR